MTLKDRLTGERFLWIFAGANIVLALIRFAKLLINSGERGFSFDLHERYVELQLVIAGHYPRADMLLADGVVSPANSVYPPFAFPALWLFSPFASFRLDQLWHAGWSLAALGFVLFLVYKEGAAVSRTAGLACASAVLALPSIYLTFLAGQFGLVLLAMTAAATVLLYRDRAGFAGLIIGVAMFKPTNVLPTAVLFLRERRFTALGIAALVVTASLAAVCVWTGRWPQELLASTYPTGGMRFTAQGYSLVTPLVAAGLSPRLASLVAGVASLAAMYLALAFVNGRRDPILVLALTGLAARLGFYHRGYDDVLLIFLLLASFRLALGAPSYASTAPALVMLASLHLAGRITDGGLLGPMLVLFTVWIATAAIVVARSAHQNGNRAQQTGSRPLSLHPTKRPGDT